MDKRISLWLWTIRAFVVALLVLYLIGGWGSIPTSEGPSLANPFFWFLVATTIFLCIWYRRTLRR
jgi:hypothetical protein